MSLDPALAHAEERCRAARSFEALAFTIANETWQAVRYRQALVWRDARGAPELLAVSGMANLPEDSPFTVWVKRLLGALWPGLGNAPFAVDLAAIDAGSPVSGAAARLSPDLIEGWQTWWPQHLAVVPLADAGGRFGAALFLLESAPSDGEMAAFGRLQSTWSYCAWALGRGRAGVLGWRPKGTRLAWIAALGALALAFAPVRQTALAPAEIVALDAVAIAAPLDGIVKTFHVGPNQPVKAGQALFSLDDTTLRNRREVTARALEVAAAELLSAQQKAFDDLKARSEVATLQGRIAERRAELRAVEEQLRRVEVASPRDGIAVFGDVNDWQGRPVTTGERILQLADPNDAGVMVFLPVADAIGLETGARIRLFLDIAPLDPVEATLSETSYLAVLSPAGIASYRLRARIQRTGGDLARIGLKGTAKLYGASVSLGYYLLRRPIAALRQWSGL